MMPSGQTIICLAPDPWEGLWRNRHQIMTRLARRHNVVYVEPRIYWPDLQQRIRDRRIGWAEMRAPLLRHHGDGLWIYHDPYYAPFAGRLRGGAITAMLRRMMLRRAIRSMSGTGEASAPILWLLRPFQQDQLGWLGEQLVVYHIVDEYSAHPVITDRMAFLEQERSLIQRADVVLVTSRALLESKGGINPNTHLVPNAVDYAGFQAALAEGGHDPTSSWDIPRPWIGYAGAMNEKIDFELLVRVATELPDCRLILIGSLDLYTQPHKADALRSLPNVHWMGRLAVDELPKAIAAMDVCLLPYERNEWTGHIDSLKLYEYFACGRPVVSTDIPAAATQGDLIRMADTPENFVAHVRAALGERDPGLVERRKAVAAANTWDDRVDQIERLLGDALARKQRVHGSTTTR